MPGLWRAVRQEGFTRLSGHLAAVERTQDPVRDLVALGAAYVDNALANPNLYRTMFDAGFDLDDPATAETFAEVVACASGLAISAVSPTAQTPRRSRHGSGPGVTG